jgi:hypothetical protein
MAIYGNIWQPMAIWGNLPIPVTLPSIIITCTATAKKEERKSAYIGIQTALL